MKTGLLCQNIKLQNQVYFTVAMYQILFSLLYSLKTTTVQQIFPKCI